MALEYADKPDIYTGFKRGDKKNQEPAGYALIGSGKHGIIQD